MTIDNHVSNAFILAFVILAIVSYCNYRFDQKQQKIFNRYKMIKFSGLAQFFACLSTVVASFLGFMCVVDPPEQPGSSVFMVIFAVLYVTFIIKTFRYRSYFNEDEFLTIPFYSNKIEKHQWRDIKTITEKNVGHDAANLQYTVQLNDGRKIKLLEQYHTHCADFIKLANAAIIKPSDS